MTKDGVDFNFKTEPVGFEKLETGAGTLIKHTYKHTESGKESTIEAELILIAAGRLPNVEGLDLEAAGVEYNAFGIKVNSYL